MRCRPHKIDKDKKQAGSINIEDDSMKLPDVAIRLSVRKKIATINTKFTASRIRDTTPRLQQSGITSATACCAGILSTLLSVYMGKDMS